MKKLLLASSAVLVTGLLVVSFTTPLFAASPDDGGATPADGERWEAMHQACENGDWEAMHQAAEEIHGEDFDGMSWHDEENDTNTHHRGGMGGHMGSSMMGGMH